MKRRIICCIVSVILCVCLAGCGSTAKVAPGKMGEVTKNNTKSFLAGENERYSLSWDNDQRRIVFLDKEKNIPWCYTPYQAMETRYDQNGLEVINHPQISSPINITIFDKVKNLTDTVIGYNGSVRKNTFSVKKIDNGVSITYQFEKEEISVTVDYTLRDDSLLVTVDPKKVKEGESYLLTAISIAPFFCSVPNSTDDTYLFIPSGSGAIVNADTVTEDVINISEEVYGSDARRPADDVIKTATANVSLPVYGAKNGDIGVTAIIEEGAEGTTLHVNSGNKNIGYSSVYADFEIRSHALMLTNSSAGQRTVYSDEYTTNPVSIGFYPIYGEDADYVGMANVYKKYLADKGMSKSKNKEEMLNLEILGGTTVTESILGVPYDTLFPTSTISQAKEMVKEISEATDVNPMVQLFGYGDNGIEISKIGGGFDINSKLGSKKDLKDFSKYCSENDIQLYYDYDILQYKKNSSDASVKFDAARTTNDRNITMYYYHLWSGTRDSSGTGWNNTSSFTLIKRSLIPEILEKTQKSAEKFGLDGVSLSTFGRIAYSDNAEQKYYAKGQMSKQVSKGISDIKKSGKKVLVSNANSYAAAVADYVVDAPLKSSQYDIYDMDVPFYQIVFKGWVPLASAPVTVMADSDDYLLRAAESGTGLTFALSYDYSNEIIDNSDIRYFGSSYKQVYNKIIETTVQHKDYYSAIKGAEIAGHEVINETLRKTEFSNGVVVYVNYSDEAQETPIGTVEAKSYLFKVGGAQQ